MRYCSLLIFILVWTLIGAPVVYGGVIASSTFNTNDEGWTNGNFNSTTPSPTSVNYLSTGGNPGGHIQVADNYNWNAFLAPASYLGNQSAAYLGTVTFDLYDTYTDTTPSPGIMISDGTTFLYSPLILDSAAGGPPFVSFSVQFKASTGWSLNVDGSSAANEAQMQSVLANLQILAIDADWNNGPDNVHLDNVVLSSAPTGVPEPGCIALVAPFAMWLVLRRRR
jgi:hypothetical protein